MEVGIRDRSYEGQAAPTIAVSCVCGHRSPLGQAGSGRKGTLNCENRVCHTWSSGCSSRELRTAGRLAECCTEPRGDAALFCGSQVAGVGGGHRAGRGAAAWRLHLATSSPVPAWTVQ